MKSRMRIWPFLLISLLLHVVLIFLFNIRNKNSNDAAIVEIDIEYTKTSGEAQKPSANNKTPSATNHKTSPTDGGSAINPQNTNSFSVSGTEVGVQANYPRLSRTLGESGQVIIEIKKEFADEAQTIQVKISSGFHRLDQSALEATKNALAQGRLVSYLENRTQMQIRFIFKLSKNLNDK